MKLFGLTGGIGMGKSASESLIRKLDIPVIDTDELARRVVDPGQPALTDVRAEFGDEVIAPDGTLRRDRLAAIVFSDPQARARLETLLHPRIRALWKAQVEAWRSEKRTAGVVVIPLLFETNAASEFDSILCVACSRATQEARLAARGWTPIQIEERRAAQLPIEEKMRLSTHVLWNEGDLDVLEAQLIKVLAPGQ